MARLLRIECDEALYYSRSGEMISKSCIRSSGDSDLLTAVRIVMNELKKPVGVINPQKRQCHVLLKQAKFYKHIRKGVLSLSQFPGTIENKKGLITKPEVW